MSIADQVQFMRLLGPEDRRRRVRNWLLHPDVVRLGIRKFWPTAADWLPPRRSHPIGLGPRAIIPHAAPDHGAIDPAGANLSELLDILDRARIDYFMVKDPTPSRFQVGIQESDRVGLLQALEQHMVAGGTVCADPVPDLIRFQQSTRRRPIGPYRRAQLLHAPTWYYLRFQAIAGVGSSLLGDDYAAVVSFWRDEHLRPGRSSGPGPNWISATHNAVQSRLGPEDRTPATVEVGEQPLPSLAPFATPTLGSCQFPVDLVCMWVDGDDPGGSGAGTGAKPSSTEPPAPTLSSPPTCIAVGTNCATRSEVSSVRTVHSQGLPRHRRPTSRVARRRVRTAGDRFASRHPEPGPSAHLQLERHRHRPSPHSGPRRALPDDQ